MRFYLHSSVIAHRDLIQGAITLAEQYLVKDSKLIYTIEHKVDWKYDSFKQGPIHRNLIKMRGEVVIKCITPEREGTAMIANYPGGALIELNALTVGTLSKHRLAGAILHEYAHYCGYHHQGRGPIGYLRRNYRTEDKNKYSVPYFITTFMEKQEARIDEMLVEG